MVINRSILSTTRKYGLFLLTHARSWSILPKSHLHHSPSQKAVIPLPHRECGDFRESGLGGGVSRPSRSVNGAWSSFSLKGTRYKLVPIDCTRYKFVPGTVQRIGEQDSPQRDPEKDPESDGWSRAFARGHNDHNLLWYTADNVNRRNPKEMRWPRERF